MPHRNSRRLMGTRRKNTPQQDPGEDDTTTEKEQPNGGIATTGQNTVETTTQGAGTTPPDECGATVSPQQINSSSESSSSSLRGCTVDTSKGLPPTSHQQHETTTDDPPSAMQEQQKSNRRAADVQARVVEQQQEKKSPENDSLPYQLGIVRCRGVPGAMPRDAAPLEPTLTPTPLAAAASTPQPYNRRRVFEEEKCDKPSASSVFPFRAQTARKPVAQEEEDRSYLVQQSSSSWSASPLLAATTTTTTQNMKQPSSFYGSSTNSSQVFGSTSRSHRQESEHQQSQHHHRYPRIAHANESPLIARPSGLASNTVKDDEKSTNGQNGRQIFKAKHWSVFYGDGIEEQRPAWIHYLHLGCYCSITCDYFSHRNPKKGEVKGHQVKWLHTAKPRDRFVFLVEPVEKRDEKSFWGMFWTFLYGTPPAFSFSRGKLLWRSGDRDSASLKRKGESVGVEALEVPHTFITAMDYAPGITTSRLAIETSVATTRWFTNAVEAHLYYHCFDKLPEMDQQAVTDRLQAESEERMQQKMHQSRLRQQDELDSFLGDASREKRTPQSLLPSDSSVSPSTTDPRGTSPMILPRMPNLSSLFAGGEGVAGLSFNTNSSLTPVPHGSGGAGYDSSSCNTTPHLKPNNNSSLNPSMVSNPESMDLPASMERATSRTPADVSSRTISPAAGGSSSQPTTPNVKLPHSEKPSAAGSPTSRSEHSSLSSPLAGEVHDDNLLADHSDDTKEFRPGKMDNIPSTDRCEDEQNVNETHGTQQSVGRKSLSWKKEQFGTAKEDSGLSTPVRPIDENSQMPKEAVNEKSELAGLHHDGEGRPMRLCDSVCLEDDATPMPEQHRPRKENERIVEGYHIVLTPPKSIRHTNTMIVVYTQDPHFNALLRELLMPEPGTHPFNDSIASQKRLLAMYETGMPSWTIFVSRWGLPYRRWFRLVAVGFINVWPAIALCVGLYDLYKHMPYVREFLQETLSPLTYWLESHFTFRIGVLITYLFTVTFSVVQSAHAFFKSFIAVGNYILSPFYPLMYLFQYIQYPLVMTWYMLTHLFTPLLYLLSYVWYVLITPIRLVGYLLSFRSATEQVGQTVKSASYFVMWWRSWMEFWEKVARPVKNVAKACYDGVVHVGVAISRREASLRRAYTARISRINDRINYVITSVWSFVSYCYGVVHALSPLLARFCLGVALLLFLGICLWLYWTPSILYSLLRPVLVPLGLLDAERAKDA